MEEVSLLCAWWLLHTIQGWEGIVCNSCLLTCSVDHSHAQFLVCLSFTHQFSLAQISLAGIITTIHPPPTHTHQYNTLTRVAFQNFWHESSSGTRCKHTCRYTNVPALVDYIHGARKGQKHPCAPPSPQLNAPLLTILHHAIFSSSNVFIGQGESLSS